MLGLITVRTGMMLAARTMAGAATKPSRPPRNERRGSHRSCPGKTGIVIFDMIGLIMAATWDLQSWSGFKMRDVTLHLI
jgi:hypothetical protein